MASERIRAQVKKASRLRTKLLREKNPLYRQIREIAVPLRSTVIKLLYLHRSRNMTRWINEIDRLLSDIAGEKVKGEIPPFGVFFAPLFAQYAYTTDSGKVDNSIIEQLRDEVLIEPKKRRIYRETFRVAKAMEMFYTGICKDLANGSYNKTKLKLRVERMLIKANEYPENGYFMTDLPPEITGLPMCIWILEDMFSQYRCRMRVQTVHGEKHSWGDVDYVTVNDNPKIVDIPLISTHTLSDEDLELVKKFIKRNKNTILKHWRRETSSMDLWYSIKKIKTETYGVTHDNKQ